MVPREAHNLQALVRFQHPQQDRNGRSFAPAISIAHQTQQTLADTVQQFLVQVFV